MLLNAGWQARRVGKYPELQELHRFGAGCVLLGMFGARAQRHYLDATRLQDAVVAEAVGMPEAALPDISYALDVSVRVHRPDRTRRQLVVVEHPEWPDTHLPRVAVAIEGEVPARHKPAALFPVDLAVAAQLEH